jgi:hypothetical protein
MRNIMVQTSFNAGEFSPLLDGHMDAPQRQNAVKTCHNLIALKQGPVTRRGGTRFVAPVKYEQLKTALLRFEFNVDQAYIIEVGDRYMRFYHHHGIILDGSGMPYEITTPYTQDQLWDAQGILQVKAVQSADILYLTHPHYPPYTLMRLDHDEWQFQPLTPEDGPYLELNDSDITLTPSGTSGAIALNASAALFVPTDEGRLIRVGHKNHWGYGTITRYKSATSVNIEIKSALAGTTATTEWRLGSWSRTTGYPSCTTFYQDRLFFAGNKFTPQRLEGSCSGDFIRFAPSDPDGTIADDHALSIVLNSDHINTVRWVMGNEKGLLVGTMGTEWLVSSGAQGKALGPNAIHAVQFSLLGSSNIAPIALGGNIAFVQRARRKVHLVGFTFEEDSFQLPDMTLFAEHITKPGLTQLAWQQEPHGVLWAVRQDGTLLGLTYEPDQHIAAWHRHTLGGAVESIAVISGYGETSQELWIIVQRIINSKVRRYVEYMMPALGGEGACLDSMLTYEGEAATTISGLEHLEGQTVGVLAEGAALHDRVVTAGGITLEYPCSQVDVGLKYRWCLETLPQDTLTMGADGMRPVGRIDHITLRLLDSLGICYGASPKATDELILNADQYGKAPALFTGDTEKLPWPSGYSAHNKILLTHDGPYPVTILAIMSQAS